ncbi:MAG: GIY-YIG catalytic domain protein [Verrucomicrobia bacterium ADurb.Bin345]|nr:MAG: GIY-YIG catalytic domain protein [Verrucomicrobia bacterium ADurb.Bin345]
MSRRAQLVCQHLENISREALEEHQDIIRQYVRRRQGVYALYRKGKLYYVGLATNLRNRLKHHLKDRHGQSWDRFSVYLTIGDHHLRELESLILRVVKPSGNKQKGKFAKSEDLRRRFRRDIKRCVLAQLDCLFEDYRPARQKHERQGHDDGRTPVLAEYISAPLTLKARYKGQTITAHVRRNGSIRMAGTVYTSPSVAGAHACKRRSCNGWTFWKYERAPGDWVLLDQLRK